MKLKILILFLLVISSNVFSQSIEENKESIDFAIIEKAPVYPGCKGTDNMTLKKCMSKKIQEYVSRNYNVSIIKNSGLKSENHNILVSFKINKNGKTVDIEAKGSIAELEIEAIRVVNSLPLMKPGIHKGKKVNVLYSLPIMFQGTM